MQPLEEQVFTVAHLKALISCCLELAGQGCGSTIMVYHALLKHAILFGCLINHIGL